MADDSWKHLHFNMPPAPEINKFRSNTHGDSYESFESFETLPADVNPQTELKQEEQPAHDEFALFDLDVENEEPMVVDSENEILVYDEYEDEEIDGDSSFDDAENAAADRSHSSSEFVFEQEKDVYDQCHEYPPDDSDNFNDEMALLGANKSVELYKVLKSNVGFNQLRHKQKQCIISVLLGYDTFVLMSKGAGKSVCYQLPAAMLPGVTVVISPSKSMVDHHIAKLVMLKIPYAALTSDTPLQVQEAIFKCLKSDAPSLKILCVTIEELSAPGDLIATLVDLHRRGLLARFVINEAHCLSELAQDFRHDYTRLCELRKKFSDPKVPLIALSDIATSECVEDVEKSLGMTDAKLFRTSFLRKNLTYCVIPKSAKWLINAVEELKLLCPGKSGIVYCMSRNECEKVQMLLSEAALSAEVYHADLDDNARKAVQRNWLRNSVDVICATMDCGTIVDKEDARFAIHYSLPKSIEDYYRDTAIAGRDKRHSYCIMMYSYNDSVRWRKMIEESDASPEDRLMRLNRVLEVVAYCENVSKCRNEILLKHFEEVYTHVSCLANRFVRCDLCNRRNKYTSGVKTFDVSRDAQMIMQSLSKMGKDTTLKNLSDLYRGTLAKKANAQAIKLGYHNLPLYGRGSAISEEDANRFVRQLVIQGFVHERLYSNPNQTAGVLAYAELTKLGKAVASGKSSCKVYLHVVRHEKQRVVIEGIVMPGMTLVTETAANKEKYMIKNDFVYSKCLQNLKDVLGGIAESCRNSFTFSVEGMEQIAAILPRTYSELLRCDSMTQKSLDKYGPIIMEVMRPYWKEVDERDYEEFWRKVDRYKAMDEPEFVSLSDIDSAVFNKPKSSRFGKLYNPSSSSNKVRSGRVSKRDGGRERGAFQKVFSPRRNMSPFSFF